MLIFLKGEIEEPGNDKPFSYHPILKSHSNQEDDDAIHHFFLRVSKNLLNKYII